MIVKVAHGETKGVYSRNSQAVQMLCRGNRSSNSLGSRRPTALQCTPLICALPDCTLNGHEDAGPQAQLGVLLERSEKDTAMIHSLSRSSKHSGPASLPQVRFSRQPHLAQLFCTRARALGCATGLPTALSGYCYATSHDNHAFGFKVFGVGRVQWPKP